MQTTYKQQIQALQKVLTIVAPEEFTALNDAASTVYAKMLEESIVTKPGDNPAKLTELIILNCEEKLAGKSTKLSDILNLLYRLRSAIRIEYKQRNKRDNIYFIVTCCLSICGVLFIAEILLKVFTDF